MVCWLLSVERGSRALGYVLVVVAGVCLVRAALLGPRPLLRLGAVLVGATLLAIGVAYVRAAGRPAPSRDDDPRRSRPAAERLLLAQHAVTTRRLHNPER